MNQILYSKKNTKRAKGLALVFCLLIALLIIFLSTGFGLANRASNKILKGVFLNNVNVGGLTEETASARMEEKLDKIKDSILEEEITYIRDNKSQMKYSDRELCELNINENDGENNNNMKNLENQIETLLKKQKMNISKSNQLIEEINNIEKNNDNKNKEINSLKKELEELKKEYNKINNNKNEKDNKADEDKEKNSKDDGLDDKVESKFSDKKINSNFIRIKIDANRKKGDNS